MPLVDSGPAETRPEVGNDFVGGLVCPSLDVPPALLAATYSVMPSAFQKPGSLDFGVALPGDGVLLFVDGAAGGFGTLGVKCHTGLLGAADFLHGVAVGNAMSLTGLECSTPAMSARGKSFA